MERVDVEPTIVMQNSFTPIKKIIEDAPNAHHFNDLLYSSYYTPWYCWRMSSGVPVHFTIGSAVDCLACGNHVIDVPDTFLCYYCDDRRCCNNCGTRVPEGEGYWVEGDLLCQDCFDEYAVECADCGEYVYRSNAYWDEDDEEWYCYYCYKNNH